MNNTVKTVKAILIGAGQRGAQVYGAFARRNPKDIQFVAVAEPDAARRAEFCCDHGISPENAVEDWHELLSRPKMADCAFVCTPVSYTHLTLPTIIRECRSRWSPSH